MPTWPASLPQVTNAGRAREVPPANLARSSIGGSFALARRRYSDSPRLFNQGFVMSLAQVATFDAFFAADLAGGKLSFSHTLARTGAAARLRIFGRPVYSAPRGEVMTVTLSFVEIPS